MKVHFSSSLFSPSVNFAEDINTLRTEWTNYSDTWPIHILNAKQFPLTFQKRRRSEFLLREKETQEEPQQISRWSSAELMMMMEIDAWRICWSIKWTQERKKDTIIKVRKRKEHIMMIIFMIPLPKHISE